MIAGFIESVSILSVMLIRDFKRDTLFHRATHEAWFILGHRLSQAQWNGMFFNAGPWTETRGCQESSSQTLRVFLPLYQTADRMKTFFFSF